MLKDMHTPIMLSRFSPNYKAVIITLLSVARCTILYYIYMSLLRQRVAEKRAATLSLASESHAPPAKVEAATTNGAKREQVSYDQLDLSNAAVWATLSYDQLDLSNAVVWATLGARVGLSCNAAAKRLESQVLRTTSARYGDEWRRQELRDAMRVDGYIEVEEWDDGARLTDETTRFANAIDLLDDAGLPTTFLLVFDEIWYTVDRLRSVLQPILGHGTCTCDFVIFNVKAGGSGWGMHRDYAGLDAKAAFESSDGLHHGLPYYNTVWLALTDASPKNSCMYVLPAMADPGYSLPESGPPHAPASVIVEGLVDEDDSDDLPGILSMAHQHIRALPVSLCVCVLCVCHARVHPACVAIHAHPHVHTYVQVSQGTALAWSQRLIHWGSAHGGSLGARKTLSFAFAGVPMVHTYASTMRCYTCLRAVVLYIVGTLRSIHAPKTPRNDFAWVLHGCARSQSQTLSLRCSSKSCSRGTRTAMLTRVQPLASLRRAALSSPRSELVSR